MGKRYKKQTKSVFARSQEVATKLLSAVSTCVGKARPRDLSVDEANDLFEMATDVANDLACFGGDHGRVTHDERRDYLHVGEAVLFAIDIFAGNEAFDEKRCRGLLFRLGNIEGDDEPLAFSSFIDEISEFYYDLFDDGDEEAQDDASRAGAKIAIRALEEFPYRFPSPEKRKARADELRAFPIAKYEPLLEEAATALETSTVPNMQMAEKYGYILGVLSQELSSDKITGSDVNSDPEILAAADDLEENRGSIDVFSIMNALFLLNQDKDVAVVARQVGMRLLHLLGELSAAVPTGDFNYDKIRGEAADVTYKIARELLQFDGVLEARTNFEFLVSLAGNMEMVLSVLAGCLSRSGGEKNIRTNYDYFVKSFEDEVEGAKELCHSITLHEPRDVMEILEQIVSLTDVKMRAYNNEFRPSNVDMWCNHCYAHELASEIDEVFEETYMPRLTILANGMENLANNLHLSDDRTDVFIRCAAGLRQYKEEGYNDDIYDEVLMRFACALVELAGIIFCNGISVEDAARLSWLDAKFLSELSRRDGIREYCVALKRIPADN